MDKNREKKWDRILKTMDDAHISALKQLANITKTWELDAKELRANIAIFKNEKWEKDKPEEKENILQTLLKKLENT